MQDIAKQDPGRDRLEQLRNSRKHDSDNGARCAHGDIISFFPAVLLLFCLAWILLIYVWPTILIAATKGDHASLTLNDQNSQIISHVYEVTKSTRSVVFANPG